MNEIIEGRHTPVDELERRVLDAARKEQPSAELSARMAGALGLSLNNFQGAPDGKAPEPNTPSGQTTAAVSKGSSILSGSWVPWVSGACVVVAAVGAVLAIRSTANDIDRQTVSRPAPIGIAQGEPLPAPSVSIEVPPAPDGLASKLPLSTTNSEKQLSSPIEPPRLSAAKISPLGPATDLRGEIASIDAARAALQSGTPSHALSLLKDYQRRYPKGSFRPEATALRIEALAKSGRGTEASKLASRFVAEHRGSPLAERVSAYQ